MWKLLIGPAKEKSLLWSPIGGSFQLVRAWVEGSINWLRVWWFSHEQLAMSVDWLEYVSLKLECECVSKYFSILRGLKGTEVGWRGEKMHKASSLYLLSWTIKRPELCTLCFEPYLLIGEVSWDEILRGVRKQDNLLVQGSFNQGATWSKEKWRLEVKGV